MHILTVAAEFSGTSLVLFIESDDRNFERFLKIFLVT
jgi:hypothetical protein